MTPVSSLPAEELYTPCTLEQYDFESMDDLADAGEFVGQNRAVAAIELGVSVRRQGFNIFALGPPGTGKHTVVRRLIEQRAADGPTPWASPSPW